MTEDTCRRGTNGTFRSYTFAGMSGGPYKGGDCTAVYTGATASVSIGYFATGGGGGLSAPKACGSCCGGNGGSGIVVVRYTAMTWRTEDMPTTLGQVGAQGAVTYSVSGEVEKDGDVIWLKPGTTATLYAVDAGGSLLVGWEDGETGESMRFPVRAPIAATRHFRNARRSPNCTCRT